jgi:methylmalonyl-CoA/ethylmalonyl-CoA epimerase
LLETTDSKGPIGSSLKKVKEFTTLLAAENLDQLTELKEKIKLLTKPRKGAEGLNIAFINPKSTFGVLTEICEKPKKV